MSNSHKVKFQPLKKKHPISAFRFFSSCEKLIITSLNNVVMKLLFVFLLKFGSQSQTR
jgi:hypothetical protein